MLTETQKRQLEDLDLKKDAARTAHFRHVTLLAAGALTVLVSLQAGLHTGHPVALWFLRSTWALLGLGILLGGAASSEEWLKRTAILNSVAEAIANSLQRKADGEEAAGPAPIVSSPRPSWLPASEKGCHLVLALAVVSLVGFSLALSW